MKGWIVVCVLCLCVHFDLWSQPIVKEFLRLGDPVLPMLSVDKRQDLIDFFQADRRASTVTLLGDVSKIEEITDSAMLLYLSEDSKLQLVMLPIDSTYINMMIHTIEGEAEMSRVSFYNRKGESLDSRVIFEKISLDAFFLPTLTVDERIELEQAVSLFSICIVFDVKQSLLCVYPVFAGRDGQDVKLVFADRFRKDPLLFGWNGKRFEKSGVKLIDRTS